MKKMTALLFAILLSVQAASANEDAVETAGDLLFALLPATAFGTTFLMEDNEGRVQFYKSFMLDAGVTYALKYTVQKERPDGSDRRSFPSAHTSVSFQSAAFIQKRYGWKYAAPAYLAASFVGYSRVRADKHYVEDVLAGTAIGIASSYFFVTPYENVTLTPVIGKEESGLIVGLWW